MVRSERAFDLSHPCVRVEGSGRGVVAQAGAVPLVETVRRTGLDAAISAALEPWRETRAVHDPGKILLELDVALAVALGGDCLADVGLLRAEPAVCGPVASDPTVFRLVDTSPPGVPLCVWSTDHSRVVGDPVVWAPIRRIAGTLDKALPERSTLRHEPISFLPKFMTSVGLLRATPVALTGLGFSALRRPAPLRAPGSSPPAQRRRPSHCEVDQ
ncbi:hypothetical protein GCM10017779_68320 [Streptomyces capillispiralis]|nr:hypothetical protein GCM10017779_68320 [Streptomyces capillispiralis]